MNEYGSVTAAAAALGYSAPAVSQQLAALEREVGMELTERAGRGIGLTPAANILVAYTDALLARLGLPFLAPRSDTSCAEMIQRGLRAGRLRAARGRPPGGPSRGVHPASDDRRLIR